MGKEPFTTDEAELIRIRDLIATGGLGVSTLGALTDVDLTGANDGDVLTWDVTTGKWIPTAVAPGGVTAVTGSAPVASSGGATPDISMAAATAANAGHATAVQITKLDGIEAGADVTDAANVAAAGAEMAANDAADAVTAMGVLGDANPLNHNRYTHPNHTGQVTSVADGATTVAGPVALTALATQAAYTFLANLTAGAAAPTVATVIQAFALLMNSGFTAGGNLSALDGVADGLDFTANWKKLYTVDASIASLDILDQGYSCFCYLLLTKSADAVARTIAWHANTGLDHASNWVGSNPLVTMGTTSGQRILVTLIRLDAADRWLGSYADAGVLA